LAALAVLALAAACHAVAAAEGDPEPVHNDAADADALADGPGDVLLWWLVRRRIWRELPGAPAPPTVTTASPTSLLVKWTPPSDTLSAIVGYDLEYRVEGEGRYATWTHDGEATDATLTDLTPSTQYEVRVRASNQAGSGDWSAPGTGKTANAPPVFAEGERTTRRLTENAPGGQAIGRPVAATDFEGDALTYSLQGPDAAYFAIVEDSGQLQTGKGVAYDHEANERYVVTVVVDDGEGGRDSIVVDIVVADVDEPPQAPLAPTVWAVSTTRLGASWMPPTNNGPPVTDYDYRYRATSSPDWNEVGHTAIADPEVTIGGLVRNTAYEIQVRATNDEGTGPWSPSGTGRTPFLNRRPSFDEGARTVRRLAENSPPGVAVGAPVAATDPDGNRLTYDLQGADAALYGIDSGTGQLWTRTGVVYDYEADPEHAVAVTVDDGDGGLDRIAVTIALTNVPEPPLAPAAPTVNPAGPERLAVRWTAPNNQGRPAITGYSVRYRGSGQFVEWSTRVAATNVTLTGLAATTYEVQVRAHNADGGSGWSGSGTGTVSSNHAPVVDEERLVDLDVTVGGAEEEFSLLGIFSDPDGDPLTFAVSSSDEAVSIAKLDGNAVTIDAGIPGTVRVDITASDPKGASVNGSFNVTVHEATLPDLVVTINPLDNALSFSIAVSFAPLEARAYRVRTRQESPRGRWRTTCFALTNLQNEARSSTLTFDASYDPPLLPDTVYELDYRYVGTSCSDTTTTPSPWSRVARARTASPVVPDSGFDIDVVFVDPQPSASHKSAINEAVAIWEKVITNDQNDIFYEEPVSDACTDGEFSGRVDDVRIYFRVQSIDGPGGTAGSAGFCRYRASTRLPIISTVTLDSDDLDNLSSGLVRTLALHEIAHALGFGTVSPWHGLLANPSSGEDPLPDTHFTGSNAVRAFDAAGGSSYSKGKVPVHSQGGSGARNRHWRKSVMDGELMTPTIGSTSAFSAITIQAMADIGYTVDVGQAESYTVFNVSGDEHPLAEADSHGLRERPRCIVMPTNDAVADPEPEPRMSVTVPYPEALVELLLH